MAEAHGDPTGPEVLVIGDLLVDIVVVPDGPIRSGTDTPSTIRTLGGGSAANTAVWLRQAGSPAALLAGVGRDPLGHQAVSEVRAAGVRFAGCWVDGAATGACVVLVDGDGERTMLPHRGANDAVPPAPVAAAARSASWVHLSAYWFLAPGSRPAALAALDAARAAGVPISVDAASAAPLHAAGAGAVLGWIDGVDVLFANEDELAVLGGIGSAARSCRALVVKRGANGAAWTDGDEILEVPAAAATVVDTVGAGDAFDAGYLHALVTGGEPHRCLTAGAQLAAQAVSTSGARPPTGSA